MNPETIPFRQSLRKADRVARLLRGLSELCAGLVIATVVVGLWVWADAKMQWGAVGRWTGFLLVMLPLCAALWMAAHAWLRRSDEAAIARRIELATHRHDNALVNAVQLERTLADDSPWRGAVLDELKGPLQSVPWKRAVDWRTFRICASAAGVVGAVSLLCFIARPAEFRQRLARVLEPAREIAPLTRTRIDSLLPGDRMVPRGTNLAIAATVSGETPGEAWLVLRADDGSEERISMSRDDKGTRWEATREWTQSARYSVIAGDAKSFERRISVRLPARPVKQQLQIDPPAYTKLPPVMVPDGQAWPAVLAGSTVKLDWSFDRPLKEMSARDPAGKSITTSGSGVQWSLAAHATTSREWSARWSDAEGLQDTRKVEFTLRADEAPKIRLLEPSGDGEVLLTKGGWLKISFEASDDFGLADVGVFRGSADKLDARVVESWKPDAKEWKQSVSVPIDRFLQSGEQEAVFCVVAKDGNNITGPGVAYSRPIVVRLVSAEEMRRAKDSSDGKSQAGLEDLAQLQRTNLEATRQALAKTTDDTVAAELAEREARVEVMAREILAGAPGESGDWRAALESLVAREIPAAVVALRDAASAKDKRTPLLRKGEALEAAILARLQGLPGAVRDEAAERRVRELIALVEALFKHQQELHGRTLKAAAPEAAALSRDEDALADESRSVRKQLDDASKNPSVGDTGFRAVLAKAAAEFGTAHIYEDMVRAAEALEQKKFPDAATGEKKILVAIGHILEMLNAWQGNKAGDLAEQQREAAEKMKEQLGAMVERQRETVEKSKQLAAKDQFRPEDKAVAKELADQKKELAKEIEQMLTDAHIFPDLRPVNELREELTKIYEDVIQQDKEQAAAGELKPQEIAVQKEDSLLQALEKAKETFEDMEMWLPNKNETQKWLLENFDKSEMPDIPNVPLADSFTDLVGDLLEEQKGLAEQVQDAASNQAFATNPANGWEVADGPMPGFNAQGKSGNTRPNKNEQTGRSSGGREGMSNGEMVNGTADHLEGSKPDVRRTNDPMQQGQIKDDGAASDARATGGGKAGGASRREGMTGAAPIRQMQTPKQRANEALAVEQAMLAQQTAKSYSTARLFYLHTGPMPEVARLMDESRDALKAGRLDDFRALHNRIVERLQQLQAQPGAQATRQLAGPAAGGVSEKRLPGGDDVRVPEGYHDEVTDYFRSLDAP
jgi:hypothetical protein